MKCTLTNHLLEAEEGTAAMKALLKRHLMGFPWAVVEVKPDDVPNATEQFCFRQAANASAAAVRMYKRLVDYCKGLTSEHIPPVVAYTCVGPKVKVWLTYFDDQSEKEHHIVS